MSCQEDQPTDAQLESRWEIQAQERQTMNDRHSKWQPVEPGHVIPSGQPYMFEVEDQTTGDYAVPDDGRGWFVDSSWRPPLELPAEPTWGIVLSEGTPRIARWYRTADGTGLSTGSGCIGIESVLGFLECTPEQVARLEQQS